MEDTEEEIQRLRLEAAKVDLEAAELRLVKVKLEIEMARMPPLRTQSDIHPSLCWPEPTRKLSEGEALMNYARAMSRE